MMSKNLESY